MFPSGTCEWFSVNSTAWGPGTLRGVHTQTALCGNLSRAISVSLGRTFSFPLVLQADDASLPFSEPLGEIPAPPPHLLFVEEAVLPQVCFEPGPQVCSV